MIFEKLFQLKDSDAVSISDGKSSLSFKQEWKYTNAIAYYLTENKIEGPVIIFADKENLVIPTMFGCVMAHVVYVPVQSAYPKERILDIVSDCKPNLVFNFSNVDFPVDGVKVVSVYEGGPIDEYLREEDYPYEEQKPDDDVMYLYTSGSTGKPKGVRLAFKSIERMAKGIANTRDGNRSLCLSPYVFSASLGTIFYANLGNSVTLYAVEKSILANAKLLFEKIKQIRPTSITCTPSVLKMLLTIDDFNTSELPELWYVTAGGEAFLVEDGKKMLGRYPSMYLINGYGATETSGDGLFFQATMPVLEKLDEVHAPIGAVLEGNNAYIVDEDGSIITEENAVGELVIAGTSLANGYLNDEELTARKFAPLKELPGVRAYHTDDLVRRENGLYFYLGRKDNLVKIGGNRIEIEDVENNLKQLGCIADCGVAVKHAEMDMMVAYVVPSKSGSALSNLDFVLKIKNELKEKVQSYMIPTKIVRVDSLPRNNNGKLDRMKLAQMAQE